MKLGDKYQEACTRRENDFWLAIYTQILKEWFNRTSVFTAYDLRAVTEHTNDLTKNAKDLGRFL